MPDIRLKYEPGKYYPMAEAAKHDMVVTITCRSCRKTVHYWAADLVKVVGGGHPVARSPWRCSKCGDWDYLQVTWEMRTAHKPMTGLVVRRPVKQVMRWLWRDEKIR